MTNILFTTLGATPLTETNYEFNSQTFRSQFCCLGLIKMLPVKFDKMCVLVTPEAKEKNLQSLHDCAKTVGIDITEIDIVSGQNIEEIWRIFDAMTDGLGSNDCPNIYLDVTNSFRHLPLLSFTALSYLESARKASLAGIYYGAFDPKRSAQTPVFDLTPLVNIVRGSYAVKTFEETGAINQLAAFFKDLLGSESLEAKPVTDNIEKLNNSFTRHLENLHSAISSGLAIEAGKAAGTLTGWMKDKLKNRFELKTTQELIARLENKIAAIMISDKLKKEKMPLTIEELQRQLKFIRWHIDYQKPDTALRLLREWLINRVWLAEEPEGDWLNVTDRRNQVETFLGGLGSKLKQADDSFKQQSYYLLAKTWNQTANMRNEFAHAGFRTQVVNVDKALDQAKASLKICEEKIMDNVFWSLPEQADGAGVALSADERYHQCAPEDEAVDEESDGKKVLITGMGASFGLLYSAVRLVQPDTVVVVTSSKFREKSIEACKMADFVSDEDLHIVEMQDVFCGFNETSTIIDFVWPKIQHAGSLVVNLTGGTTAMQWVMQAIYERSHAANLSVERVAFVDRRPAVEQQQTPWCLGEIVEIEKITSKPLNYSE